VRTIDHVRAEAESVDRDRPSFLRVPDRPTTAEPLAELPPGKVERMPALGQPTEWSDADVIKMFFAGAFLGMLVTLLAQHVLL